MAGDEDVAERIKRAYLEQVDLGFEYAEQASVELFGHEIPQILLIHCNELNALTLARHHRAVAEARIHLHPAGRGDGGCRVRASRHVRRPRRIVAVADGNGNGPEAHGQRGRRFQNGLRASEPKPRHGRATERARPPAFREDWKETPAATPVTQEHVANPDLILTVHGPGRDGVKKSHHDQPADDPYYIWSGDTTAPWAVSLRHRRGPIDLSGSARIRWRAKQSGFYELRPIVQVGPEQWLVADAERWPRGGLARARVPGLRADLARPGHHPNRRRPRGREAGSVQGARGWCDRPARGRRNARQLAAGLDRGVRGKTGDVAESTRHLLVWLPPSGGRLREAVTTRPVTRQPDRSTPPAAPEHSSPREPTRTGSHLRRRAWLGPRWRHRRASRGSAWQP